MIVILAYQLFHLGYGVLSSTVHMYGNIWNLSPYHYALFGAFVELEPGVDALLHVSQIARRHIEKPADVLQIGQEIEAQIVDFNEADRKISLSMKALEMPQQQNADEIVYSESEAAQGEQ